jgi:hypothetical protein
VNQGWDYKEENYKRIYVEDKTKVSRRKNGKGNKRKQEKKNKNYGVQLTSGWLAGSLARVVQATICIR